ncbi:MAG: MFS transporter [Treponema sp.]|nr:MFS transporter [Treponema sp.]
MENKKFSLTSSNFGSYGWFLVVYSIILFIFSSGLNVAGLNLTVQHFAKKGWNYDLLLSFSTYGGYFSIITAPFLGWLMDKAGLQKYFFGILLACAAGCLLWGYAFTPAIYFIGVALVSAGSNGASFLGTSNLIALYFPRKKGVVMGWTTMGINISDVIYLPVLSILIAGIGVSGSYLLIAVIFVIMAVVSILFIKNNPEEKGIAPDNEPLTAAELEQLRVNSEKEKHLLTFKEVVRQPQAWIDGVIYGCMNMCTTGILSQAVVYLVSRDIPQGEAIMLMSIAALFGCLGSYLWGVLDGRIGPRRTGVALAAWALVAVFLIVLPFNKIRLYIAIIMFMFSAGGLANVGASLVASQFGRFGFAKAFGIINPITQVIRVSAFAVLALGLSLFDHSFNRAFILFLGAAVIAFVCSLFVKDTPLKVSSNLNVAGEK